MGALFVGYLAALLVTLLHVAFTVGIGRRVGARAQTGRLFVGPLLARRTLGGVDFELGAIPVGSYVAFARIDGGDDGLPTEREHEAERTTLDEVSRARRLAVVLLPWFIIVSLTMPILGPVEAWESLARGLVQVVHGAVQPFDIGAPLLARYFEAFRTMSPVAFAAALATKLVAFNLLPFSGTAGQQAIHRGFTDKPTAPRWLALLGLVFGLSMMLGWSVAIYAYWAA